jgi:replication initiation and membrane attachment protein
MLEDLSSLDLYEVKAMSLFSDFDKQVLVDLYLPLMGAPAFGIFCSLLNEKKEEVFSHEGLLAKNQVSPGEFVSALKVLEALSLIQTYLDKSETCRLFIYALYSPCSPKEFFADPLLAGTLNKYIGKKACETIAKKYALESTIPDAFQNVSESFLSYFSPDFQDKSYGKSTLVSGEKVTRLPNVNFSESAFLTRLQELDNRYDLSSFGKDELFQISRLSALYGYSSDAVADLVNSSFSFSKPLGKRLDKTKLLEECENNVQFSYLKERKADTMLVHGSSSFANVTRKMESLTPIQFLSSLQKGHKPAPADVKLIEELTLDMGLKNGVCNALIFYVLYKQNNSLPKAYTEKIGASLIREGLTTAIDTMNYFSLSAQKKKKQISKEGEKPFVSTPKETTSILSDEAGESQKSQEDDEEDFEKVVSSLHWKKGQK